MFHVLLAIHLVALCFGAAVCSIAFFRAALGRRRYLLVIALSLAASSVMMVADSLATYDALAGDPLGSWLVPTAAALSGIGGGMAGWAMPAFIYTICRLKPSVAKKATRAALCLALGATGVVSWLVPAPLRGAPIGFGLAALNLVLTAVFVAQWRRIERAGVLRLARGLCIIVVVTTLGTVAQTVFSARLVDLPLNALHPVQIASYLAIAALLLHHMLVDMPRSEASEGAAVPGSFVATYGISPREAEIVALVLQGCSNRTIGQRLYISDRTVKNHVYSIYRKTGVSNKVQLSNLVRQIRPE